VLIRFARPHPHRVRSQPNPGQPLRTQHGVAPEAQAYVVSNIEELLRRSRFNARDGLPGELDGRQLWRLRRWPAVAAPARATAAPTPGSIDRLTSSRRSRNESSASSASTPKDVANQECISGRAKCLLLDANDRPPRSRRGKNLLARV
jgi:hypothetical protein